MGCRVQWLAEGLLVMSEMTEMTMAGDAAASKPERPSAPTTERPAVLDVQDLTVEFGDKKGRIRVVDQVSFSVRAGETLGLVGQSGSGKSMTALSLMGLLRRDRRAHVSGRAMFEGVNLIGIPEREGAKLRGSRISMVFQDPMSSLNPVYSVGEHIAETVRRHKKLSRGLARAEAIRLLDLVGIPGAARRVGSYPHEFSGGMRQRVMMAMAVSCDPALLIADEPTTALDVTVQAQILELLRMLQSEFGMSILFITHDLAVVADICDRVAVMYAGQLTETSDAFAIFDQPLHPYTEALLCSTPEYLGLGERTRSGTGAFPKVGCRFAPRCPHTLEQCTTADIALSLHPQTDDHQVRCVRAEELKLESATSLWARATEGEPTHE